MSYRFKDSGRGGIDAVFVTKKGETEGGFPAGFIIPIGYFHIEGYRREIEAAAEENGLQTYVAKHCSRPDELTHVVPKGFVNRFGIFFTKEKMPEGDWCLDAGKGEWFTRKNFASVGDVFMALTEKRRKKRC